jgi:hypothetical protein
LKKIYVCKGKGEGIRLLLNSYVQREAIHDSSARGDLGCHPDTREEYIRSITGWGGGEWESEKRAFLMTGPAGAGKSAIARTCAYNIEAAGNLGASFFFYRPSGWNDPKKFIPTIVYQLTTRFPAYRDRIDAIILDDPLVLEKAMDAQFRDLLVKPLRKVSADGHGVGKDMVIVVDGLDECAVVDAQVQIIHLIAASTREQTTPFLWACFSRPEPPITSAFSFNVSPNISWTLPLTLSGSAESDIEAYLRGSFKMICAKHNIPAGKWPAEEDIRRLVSQSAGLFVYVVTALRYIEGLGRGRSGLEERLRAVLQLDSMSTESPFSALDRLYILVMMQIPEGVLSDTMSLLYLDQSPAFERFVRSLPGYHVAKRPKVTPLRSALGLSSTAFHVAISNLYSVLEVTMSQSGEQKEVRFYHRSFLDFLLDSRRSKQYFIESPVVRQHCLEMIIHTMSTAIDTGASEYPNCGFI